MLRPRIIPVLLLTQDGLVKTKNFTNPQYIGDPINAVKIFNEKKVDELTLLDIEVSKYNQNIKFDLLSKIASQSRMPLCYGGGIKTLDEAAQLISMGFEKISLSSSVISNPDILDEIVSTIGAQSVVVCVDVKRKTSDDYQIYTHGGTRNTEKKLLDFVKYCETKNIGELIVNSIDNDGMMNGYDLDLAVLIRKNTNYPLTFVGGAGNTSHMESLISKVGVIGVGVGSLFVFQGKYRAVLINYVRPKLN